MFMHSINPKIVNFLFLFTITSVSLILSLQTIYPQTSGTNSTRSTPADSQIQWKVYVNDKFGFTVEYPQFWIIDEKQNRFEYRPELLISSPELSNPDYGQFGFTSAPPSPTDNITLMTDLSAENTINSVYGEMRLIEDTNVTRYKIDGEKAGAYIYVLDERDSVTESKPVVAAEVVVTIHNGKAYMFQFLARPSNFDSPTLTEIRQHMFNSIKWK
jgi:PsbP-like protein